jgi:hypothetical protein
MPRRRGAVNGKFTDLQESHMPRTFSAPSTEYVPNPGGSPRDYGPLVVDRFTRDDTSALVWTATVEGWPDDPTQHLFTVRCEWSDGSYAEWPVHGGRRNRDGTPATLISERVNVPEVGGDGPLAGRKADVVSGSMTLRVYAPFRTAFTLAAAE